MAARPWAERALDLVPLALALWIAVQVLGAFVARIPHPFDLEWMEGGMLAHAWRLQHHLPLYVEPNPDFVPFIYPPGYSALLAALGKLFGLGYPLGRLISAGSTLAAAAAIVFVAVRQTSSWTGGLCGAACYLGLFRASGGFYDLVRPDALGVALTAWSLGLALERRRHAELASALLLCAAYLVKHNLAAFGLPIVGLLWARGGWPVAARFAVASMGSALAITGWLQLRSSGRFLTYLLEVPGTHPLMFDRFVPGTPGELSAWLLPSIVAGAGWLVGTASLGRRPSWRWLGVALLAAAGAVWGWQQPPIRGIPMGPPAAVALVLASLGAVLGASVSSAISPVGERPSWRWVAAVGVGGTALLLAALMRAHYGGFLNVLMPAHWACSLGLAVVVGHVRLRWPSLATSGATMLLLVAQLGWLARELETESILPTSDDVVAGEAVLEALEQACGPGPILAPHTAWLPVGLGRPPSIHMIAIWDLNHPGGPFEAQMVQAMRGAARDHYWSCVLQGDGRNRVEYGTLGPYQRDRRLVPPASTLRPKTGWRVRPTEILSPAAIP
ncbi:MAG TPA: hypothetical protein ENK18_15315 [Deltaproteobacteria bacterium]|nr:hypothetical protein [Deltaproteobacteria bacterium]